MVLYLARARARARARADGRPRSLPQAWGSGASPPAFAQGVSAGLLAGVCLRARVFQTFGLAYPQSSTRKHAIESMIYARFLPVNYLDCLGKTGGVRFCALPYERAVSPHHMQFLMILPVLKCALQHDMKTT